MARARKNFNAYLEGAEELDRALKAKSDRAGGFLLRQAAQDGAEVLRKEIEHRAPRGAEDSPASARYGKLKDNIYAKVKRAQIGRTQVEAGPGRDQFWARFVEKGTSRMRAKPFIRPAFEAAKDAATRAVGETLKRGLLDGGT